MGGPDRRPGPGYRRLRTPRPGGGLTHAAARLDTPYGLASVVWTRSGDTLTVTATIPPGTVAEVDLPFSETVPGEGGAGTRTFTGTVRPPGHRLPAHLSQG